MVDVFLSNQLLSKDTLAKYLPRMAPHPLFSATHRQKDSPVTDSGLGVGWSSPNLPLGARPQQAWQGALVFSLVLPVLRRLSLVLPCTVCLWPVTASLSFGFLIHRWS